MTTPAKTEPVRKPQIRPRLKAAIELMVSDGLTIGEAADRAGMQYEGLRVALHKPHVQAFLASVKRERVGLESLRSFHRVTKLRDEAQSEKVQLDAAKTIMTVAGDMDGEKQAPPASPVAIQFIIADRYAVAPPLSANGGGGVYELPPFVPVYDAA